MIEVQKRIPNSLTEGGNSELIVIITEASFKGVNESCECMPHIRQTYIHNIIKASSIETVFRMSGNTQRYFSCDLFHKTIIIKVF